jgi:hypothetical protein
VEDPVEEPEPEEVEPVEESTKSKIRSKNKPLNESSQRTETTVTVTRINESSKPDSTERRVEHLVKSNKSK